MATDTDEGLDPTAIAANQEGEDLSSIQEFGGKTIDDPTTVHQQEDEGKIDDDKIDGETDEEKEARLAAEAEFEDEEFGKQYDDISKVWTRPTVKDLTAKYPNLFKNFPDLRTVMFREGKFTELFPTLEEAQEASLAKEENDILNERIVTGDVASMLEDVPKESLPKIAGNFLPALYKKDSDLYHKMMNPIIDRVLKAAYQEGDRAKNDNLKYGAEHLSKYIFGDESFASGDKSIPALTVKEDKELEEERAKFKLEQFNQAREAVVNYSVKRLENEIKSGLPKDIPQRLAVIIVDQVIEQIDKTLNKNQDHLDFMKRLWKQAEKGNFSGEHKARISSAYLARARNMVPKLRQELLNDLVGAGDDTRQQQRRLKPSGGPPSSEHRQQLTSKNVQYEKSDDLSIIQGNATLKK